MKTLFILCVLAFFYTAQSQELENHNLFIITTDGFRWQEVFNGADSALINDPTTTLDTSLVKQLYWDQSPEERRKKLMPFFWNVIIKEGQIYGNRQLSNKMDVKNPYKISYPGYNELLTGYADPIPVLNTPTFNRNRTILEYFNNSKNYRGRVAAFSSWYIFPFVFNNKRNDFTINSGYCSMTEGGSDSSAKINAVQLSLNNAPKTRYDLLTFLTAREYIQSHHPKIVYLSFGETDEFAHQKRYDMYLQRANDVDKMIADLWYYLQTDPFYKNNTTLLITTDHGRGSNTSRWSDHGLFTKGSGEIWMALIGKNILRMGEMKNNTTIYQNQLAATMASLIDHSFEPSLKMGKRITLPINDSQSPNGNTQDLASLKH